MELKYKSEIFEDQLYREFYSDTNEHWSQREQPGIRDFIKWAIIKGYLKDKDDTTITMGNWNTTPLSTTPLKIGDIPINLCETKC